MAVTNHQGPTGLDNYKEPKFPWEPPSVHTHSFLAADMETKYLGMFSLDFGSDELVLPLWFTDLIGYKYSNDVITD